MNSDKDKQYISWRQLSPIFADVVLSPWNLLVGGLLIHFLSVQKTLASIIVGYLLLGLVFVLYGGLGFKKRQQSAQILHEVFKGKFSLFFIPGLLAFGQLGWAAVNISLGGDSLASVSDIPSGAGMVIYAAIIGIMAGLKLFQMSVVKFVITISAILLVSYIAYQQLTTGSYQGIMDYHPSNERSLFWGVGIVFASLVSFAAVSPDFFRSIRKKADIVPATIVGIVVPGIVICFIGSIIFYGAEKLDLVLLIGGLSFATLPHLFNMLTNTDGSAALYTPALKFNLIFKLKHRFAVALGAVISLSVSLLGITSYFESWLKVLSILSPIFIGMIVAVLVFNKSLLKK